MQSRKERSLSYFINLRKFHNIIKRELYDKYTKNIDNLLEIAIGKTGDLKKFLGNNIKNVVGYDINEQSINEGKRRVAEEKQSRTKIDLYVKDLSTDILEKTTVQYDVVSCQFAFHYFFKSKDTFETIMTSIDNNIRRGGYFIGTLFDGESINNLPHEFILKDKNDIKFSIKKLNKTDSIYGNEIEVYLNDTVLNEPTIEYVVDFKEFTNLMKSRGYDLVESNMFKELHTNKNELSELSKQISFLNRTFVFKKTECVNISSVLRWCPGVDDILIFNKKILKKYKVTLTEKMDESTNEKQKHEYKYIRDNLINTPSILLKSDVPDNVKRYMSYIYKEYMNDLK